MAYTIESISDREVTVLTKGGVFDGSYLILQYRQGEDPEEVVRIASLLDESRNKMWRMGAKALGKESTPDDRKAFDDAMEEYGRLLRVWVNGRAEP